MGIVLKCNPLESSMQGNIEEFNNEFERSLVPLNLKINGDLELKVYVTKEDAKRLQEYGAKHDTL